MSTKVWENLMCMEADKLFKKSRWYGKIGEALTIRSEASEVSSDDMKQIWRQWSVHIGKIARLGPIYFTIDWMHSIRKGCVDVSTIFSWTRAGDNLVAKQFSHNLLLNYRELVGNFVGRVHIHLITYLEDEFGRIWSDYLLNLLKCNDQNVKTKFILLL
jgi:hypothetical protein